MKQHFIPFYYPIMFHRRDAPHCVYTPVSQCTSGLCPLWAVMNNAAVNICAQLFVSPTDFKPNLFVGFKTFQQ